MKGIEADLGLLLQAPGGRDFELKVAIDLPASGVTCISGQSGSGKTTLLRCIAGLQRANGRLVVNGEVWQDEQTFLPTHARNLGYVFQEASLLPHLTAEQNIDYALRRSKGRNGSALKTEIIDLLEIGNQLAQMPGHLSGGERQRVAIARAIVAEPSLLLMDEPLASLDQARKQEVMHYIERLRHRFDIPIIYVSHAMDEIARLADHLILLEDGNLLASGPLQDVLGQIKTPLHLGEETGVVIDAEIREHQTEWGLIRAGFDGGDILFRDNTSRVRPGAEKEASDEGDEVEASIGKPIRVRILARDVSLTLANHEDTSILNRWPAIVDDLADDEDAAMMLIKLKVGATAIIARLTRKSVSHLGLIAGKQVCVQVKSVAIVD